MISKVMKRKIMGFSTWLVGLSFFGLLKLANLTLDSKIFNLIDVKTLFGISLFYVGYVLIFNKELV